MNWRLIQGGPGLAHCVASRDPERDKVVKKMRRASKTGPHPPTAAIKFIVCISEICRPLKSVPHVTLAPQTWKTASECCTTAFANHPQVIQNPAREKSRRKTSFWRTRQSGNMVCRLAFNLNHKNPIFPKNKCNIFHMILFSIRSKVDNVTPYRQECVWACTVQPSAEALLWLNWMILLWRNHATFI